MRLMVFSVQSAFIFLFFFSFTMDFTKPFYQLQSTVFAISLFCFSFVLNFYGLVHIEITKRTVAWNFSTMKSIINEVDLKYFDAYYQQSVEFGFDAYYTIAHCTKVFQIVTEFGIVSPHFFLDYFNSFFQFGRNTKSTKRIVIFQDSSFGKGI